MMCIISKTIYLSSVFSLVYPMASFASFNPAYASLVDTSQNQTFESRPANSIKLAAVHFITNDNSLRFDESAFPTTPADDNCKRAGYALTKCSSGNPTNFCSYDDKYFKECCDAKFKYNKNECLYPSTLSSTSCGGKYMCFCDRSLYPYSTCPSPQINNGDRCVEEGKVYYSGCICPLTYNQTCEGKNQQGADGGCIENNTTKYKSCRCKPGYNLTCSELGPVRSNDYCQLEGIKYYNECLTCSSEYIYDSSNCLAPGKLSGETCGSKYTRCELDESKIICDNFTLPAKGSYAKLVTTCDELFEAVNSGIEGNIVLAKQLQCSDGLALKAKQKLVGIGYFLSVSQEKNDYQNQLNQCYTLSLNGYPLRMEPGSGISDVTMVNSGLMPSGNSSSPVTIHNVNIKTTQNDVGILATGQVNLSGFINIKTPGSIGISHGIITMNNAKVNIKAEGDTNYAFSGGSNVTLNGNTIVNMDMRGASGQGQAINAGCTFRMNDTSMANIISDSYNVEATTSANLYFMSSNVRFNAKTDKASTFYWKPTYHYVTGARVMTSTGIYEAVMDGSYDEYCECGSDKPGRYDYRGWKQISSTPDFSDTTDFGQQMKIFETKFFSDDNI